MKRVVLLLLIVACFCFAACGLFQDSIVGSWRVVAFEIDGMAMEYEDEIRMSFVNGNKGTYVFLGEHGSLTWKLEQETGGRKGYVVRFDDGSTVHLVLDGSELSMFLNAGKYILKKY